MVASETLDDAISATRARIDAYDRAVGELIANPERHRRVVETLLLYRDCLFELEETRKLLNRQKPPAA